MEWKEFSFTSFNFCGQTKISQKLLLLFFCTISINSRVNNQNERMEIIDYKNAACMTVRFDDGTVHHNVQYHNFCKGRVKKTESKEIKKSQAAEQKFGAMECRTDRIGEERSLTLQDSADFKKDSF